MVNRFVLNETSYHGAGAIGSIAEEAMSRGYGKAFRSADHCRNCRGGHH